jgi:hypothetical protein
MKMTIKRVIYWVRWIGVIPAWFVAFHFAFPVFAYVLTTLGGSWGPDSDISLALFVAIMATSAFICLLCAAIAPVAKKRVAILAGLVGDVMMLVVDFWSGFGQWYDIFYYASVFLGGCLAAALIFIFARIILLIGHHRRALSTTSA